MLKQHLFSNSVDILQNFDAGARLPCRDLFLCFFWGGFLLFFFFCFFVFFLFFCFFFFGGGLLFLFFWSLFVLFGFLFFSLNIRLTYNWSGSFDYKML